MKCPHCGKQPWDSRDINADLEKIADSFFEHLTTDDRLRCWFGLDQKRPFGYSDTYHGITEIIELEYGGDIFEVENAELRTYIDGLVVGLIPFLQDKWRESFKGKNND